MTKSQPLVIGHWDLVIPKKSSRPPRDESSINNPRGTTPIDDFRPLNSRYRKNIHSYNPAALTGSDPGQV